MNWLSSSSFECCIEDGTKSDGTEIDSVHIWGSEKGPMCPLACIGWELDKRVWEEDRDGDGDEDEKGEGPGLICEATPQRMWPPCLY